ncbi:MAG: hypothetical protein RI575_04810 [Balneolaceae bacterium]|nr:hypothetical protein [Balneolaceae bacterium]MDR9409141.1 hypothetical protein [Balneolaceae bacterium]
MATKNGVCIRRAGNDNGGSFVNPELINEGKAEFNERKGDYVYEGMIPFDLPPLDFE